MTQAERERLAKLEGKFNVIIGLDIATFVAMIGILFKVFIGG
jgi:hypothetical protein